MPGGGWKLLQSDADSSAASAKASNIVSNQSASGMSSSAAESVGRNAGDAELKLSIQATQCQLNINLIAARNLCSQRGKRCCSFVRISFYPEGQSSEKCQTKVVPDTDFPLYNEHFVLNLPQDRKKNLLVSAWNQLGREGFSEFLGNIAFPLESLINSTKTSGWHPLLNEIARTACGSRSADLNRQQSASERRRRRRQDAQQQPQKYFLPPPMAPRLLHLGVAKSPSALPECGRESVAGTAAAAASGATTSTTNTAWRLAGAAAGGYGGAFRRDVKSLYDIASYLPGQLTSSGGGRSPEPRLLFMSDHRDGSQQQQQPKQHQVFSRPASSLLHCGRILLLERGRSSEARCFLFPDSLIITDNCSGGQSESRPDLPQQLSESNPLSLLLDPLPMHRIAHCFVPEGAANDLYLQLAGDCNRMHVLRLRCVSEFDSRCWCRLIQEQLQKIVVL